MRQQNGISIYAVPVYWSFSAKWKERCDKLTCFSAATCNSKTVDPLMCLRFLIVASAGTRRFASGLNDCCSTTCNCSTSIIFQTMQSDTMKVIPSVLGKWIRFGRENYLLSSISVLPCLLSTFSSRSLLFGTDLNASKKGIRSSMNVTSGCFALSHSSLFPRKWHRLSAVTVVFCRFFSFTAKGVSSHTARLSRKNLVVLTRAGRQTVFEL